jgi:CheY-like chemotaxis protein
MFVQLLADLAGGSRVDRVDGAPTIVVAEDDDELRDLIADILEGAGYDVIPARNGKQVADYLLSVEQTPAAVLLDLLMPLVSGWELLRFVQGHPRFGAIPIVIMTGVSRDRPTGVAGVLKKPFRVHDLLATVLAASCGQSPDLPDHVDGGIDQELEERRGDHPADHGRSDPLHDVGSGPLRDKNG